MVRFAVFVFSAICVLAADRAVASEVPTPAGVAATPASIETAQLLAREIAARAQAGGFAHGRFTPSVPRAAAIRSSTATPQSEDACDGVKGLAADTTDASGMRFMPLKRERVRAVKMPPQVAIGKYAGQLAF